MGDMEGKIIVENFIGGKFLPSEINNVIPRYNLAHISLLILMIMSVIAIILLLVRCGLSYLTLLIKRLTLLSKLL